MSRDSDIAEIGRFMKAEARAKREAGWADRDTALQALREAGFEPVLLSEESRHYRIRLPGVGHFDFWPSSGKWAEGSKVARHDRLRGRRGIGAASLIEALHAARKSTCQRPKT